LAEPEPGGREGSRAKESKAAWEAVFADLIRRGLDPATIQLGITGGLPGLERAFLTSFRKATAQRCQVHKAKNVLGSGCTCARRI
jgi:transposase-like protein